MYWLFNGNNFNLTGKEKEVLNWEQGRNFKGEPGDQVVVFEFDSKNKFFTYLFKITEVEIKSLSNEKELFRRNVITVTLQLVEDFKNEKEIHDYLYSFPRIVYFDSRLYRHFNRKYYRLSEEEFHAIINDEIFEARSVVGAALNALHTDHRKSFVRLLIENMPGVLKNKYDHVEVLSLLNEYMRYAVITPAQQLLEAYKEMEDVIPDDIRRGLGFSDEYLKEGIDIISNQVEIIDDTLETVQVLLLANDNAFVRNRKFERIFRSRPLPIDLNE